MHSRQPHTWQQLLCLLSIVALIAGHQDHGQGPQRPDWLMGLQQLLQQQAGQPSVSATASMQSYHNQPPTAAAASDHGVLLRPKTLPAIAAAHLAGLQRAGSQTSSGVTLGSVARSYGITQRQLRNMMEQDQGLLVSNHGLLVWVCSRNGHSHAIDDDRPTAVSGGSRELNGAGWQEWGDEPAAAYATYALEKASTSAASGEPGMAWLAGGLFTAMLGPSDLARADTAGSLADSQARSWTAVTSATLQTTSTSQYKQAEPLLAAAEVSSAVVQQPGPLPPPEQAFKLHNRPPGSVLHTIFLDFRGCSISSSYWNTATSKAVLTTQPYDLDGEPGAFSVQEQQAIVSIWQAVAQDFAPWAVDVTTEDPGLDALVKTDADDAQFGMHVCIGGSSATTVGGLSGGLAFTGAWGQLGAGLQPVLVFPEQLGKGHPRAVADSISHEVGHTIGLAHFGGSGSAPYNDGAGPWGPLLGLPYGRVLSQWSVGTAVTGVLQDDLQLIAQQLASFEDDHGDGPAAATPLCERAQAQVFGSGPRATASGQSQHGPAGVSCKHVRRKASDPGNTEQLFLVRATVRGVISNSSDQDWFRLYVSQPGQVHMKLQLPSSESGYGVNNLLASIAVIAGDGTLLATVKPEAGSEVMLQATADVGAAGTVYVSVVPTGLAGVSSYGSLGDYLLTVSFPGQPPAQQAVHDTSMQALDTRSSQGCQQQQCTPCAGCGWCDSAGNQQCICSASKGFVLKVHGGQTHAAAALAGIDQAASGAASSCQYQQIKQLSFSAKTCSTAQAGTVVLLKFIVSDPPACFEGSIIAAAPSAQLLQSCPCRQPPKRAAHELPVPKAGAAVPTDGSFSCQDGVYSYGWQVPSTLGCYRLSISMVDGSSVLTVLRLVSSNALTQAEST